MNLETVTDLSDLLPPAAKSRFTVLNDAVADDTATGGGFSSQILDKMDDRDRAKKRRGEIKLVHPNVTDDHDAIREQDRIIADADAALVRLNERAAKHNAIAGPRANLLRVVKGWIRKTVAGHDIVDVELVDPPKLLKGETPATAVDRLRRRLRELDSDRRRIEASPFPSSYAKLIAANHIDKLADAAAPVVTNLVEHGGGLIIDGQPIEDPITFATKMVSAQVDTATGRGVSISEVPDVVGLVAFVCRDLLLAKVGELIDAEAEDKIALTHEQRREQLAVIAADREHVEQEEAHWLWQAFAAGVIVEPRADMAPACFLQVQALKASRSAGTDHAEVAVRIRDAASAAEGGVPFGPNDIRIPGRP